MTDSKRPEPKKQEANLADEILPPIKEHLEQAHAFLELLMQYKCALMEVETKLNVLNAEFALKHSRNPFESIKSRIKTPASILEKLFTVESIEGNLFDIAGIRVICSFPDDIYTTAALLAKQDDVRVLTEKDYIKNPKPNGYRSLHLIVEVPIFLSEEKKYMKVEVQFRTIAMDFWASLEHKLKYKKDLDDQAAILAELKACADGIATLDLRMQSIRDRIGESKE